MPTYPSTLWSISTCRNGGKGAATPEPWCARCKPCEAGNSSPRSEPPQRAAFDRRLTGSAMCLSAQTPRAKSIGSRAAAIGISGGEYVTAPKDRPPCGPERKSRSSASRIRLYPCADLCCACPCGRQSNVRIGAKRHSTRRTLTPTRGGALAFVRSWLSPRGLNALVPRKAIALDVRHKTASATSDASHSAAQNLSRRGNLIIFTLANTRRKPMVSRHRFLLRFAIFPFGSSPGGPLWLRALC